MERPLVGAHDDEDYEQSHGVPAPGRYQPPTAVDAVEPSRGSITAILPSQADELQEISVLSKDAAEIMWEMVALGEGGAAMVEMKQRAQQLQAQLRGLINDYSGGDETLLAGAFQSFDMLSSCLDDQQHRATDETTAEQDDAGKGLRMAGVPAEVVPRSAATPAPIAPTATTSAAEAPLISFD